MIVFMLLLSPLARGPVLAEEIRIGGTGGALGLMKRLATEYRQSHPAVIIKVVPSLGSSGGIKALSAGALDIAVTSRPIDKKDARLVSRALARTPFVFLTGKNNPVTAVTLKELADLYAGRVTQWPDGRPSRLVLRPATEFDTELMKRMSPEMEKAVSSALATEGMIMGVTDQDSADALERVPGAVGTGTLGQIITEERSLKALHLNGVQPGIDTLSSGSYPYFKPYYLVSHQKPAAAVASFLDFVRSDAGRKVMMRSGYLVRNQ